MTTIVGLPSSLRSGSFNAAPLHAAVDLMPDGATLQVGAVVGGVFGPDGTLVDDAVREQLRTFLAGFAARVAARARR